MNSSNTIEVYYFSGKDCGVCHALRPKLTSLFNEKFPFVPIQTIDIEQEPEKAAQYFVFTLPVVLVLLDGKEQFRFARSFSIFEVEQKVSRLIELSS